MKRIFSFFLFLHIGLSAFTQNILVNNREGVDLNLPSGKLWASCNIGADNPEQFGTYYNWTNNPVQEYWDDEWRTPTKEERDELTQYCTYSVDYVNGVKGARYTGSNGNSIFLPFAGYYKVSFGPYNVGIGGQYWTYTPFEDSDAHWILAANSPQQYDDNAYYWPLSYFSFPVRPVCDGNIVVLDENSTDDIAATDGPVKVVVKRTLKKDQWSTICLPFNMTAEQVYAAFGDDVQLQEFVSYDTEYDAHDNVRHILVHFVDADLSDGFYGNHPYVIKVSEDISEFSLTTTINPIEEECYSEYAIDSEGNRHVYGTFYGTYHAQTIVPANGLFISDNQFWYSTGKTKMKAFRGWFEFEDVLAGVAADGSNIRFTFDRTTGIQEIRSQSMAEGSVYTLQGQFVGKDIDLKELPRGIYIVNGKKQVIK